MTLFTTFSVFNHIYIVNHVPPHHREDNESGQDFFPFPKCRLSSCGRPPSLATVHKSSKMSWILQIYPCKNVLKTKRKDAFIAQGELEMKKGSDGKKSLYFFDRLVNHF